MTAETKMRPSLLTPVCAEEDPLGEAVELFAEAGLPASTLFVPEFSTRFPHRGDLVAHQSSESEILVFTDWWMFDEDSRTNKLFAWLFVDEEPASFMSLHVGRNPTGELPGLRETTIGTVEVRASMRGSGLASRTGMLLQEYTGHIVHSSGHYTPEGYKSLAGKFPYTRDTLSRQEVNRLANRSYDEVGVWFDSTDFVESWDSLAVKQLV